jgi:hypothetical protein
MAWVRFDPGFTRHKKRLKAGPIANWLWVASTDYCVEHLTDGILPREVVPTLIPGIPARQLRDAISTLLDQRSWEDHPDGYLVHDFLDYQESSSEVRRQRAAGRERAKRFRNASSNVGRNALRTPLLTPNVRRESHDSAVLSCTKEESAPHNGERTALREAGEPPPDPSRPYRWPNPGGYGPRWEKYPHEAMHFDCPEGKWRGRCMKADRLAEFPGAKQCAHHAKETS